MAQLKTNAQFFSKLGPRDLSFGRKKYICTYFISHSGRPPYPTSYVYTVGKAYIAHPLLLSENMDQTMATYTTRTLCVLLGISCRPLFLGAGL